MAPDGPSEQKKAPRDWAPGEETTPRDGRTARAHRTRQAVADALLSLIDEGELRPTSKCIAERAGVSERTIFQHFEDLETLFRVAADRLGGRVVDKMSFVSNEGPFADRVVAYVNELSAMHEAMTPIRRASRLHEPFSPVLSEALSTWRGYLRRGIERVFANELAALADDAVRQDVVEAVALVVTWSSWDNMRGASDFSIEHARHIMAIGIRGILGCSAATPSTTQPGSESA